MGKRLIISESEKNNIRKMYGLLNEQKYMDKYGGSLLDFCGYRAVEQFEETKGNEFGGSMGDNYFEKKVDNYETKISNNLNNTIGLQTFQKFPPKLKMQIWSFMFNGTDASGGTVKWLAGLAQAMGLNKKSTAKDEQAYRVRVMNKNSDEYRNAIAEIKNYKGSWDSVYSEYLTVLDKQYQSTAENNNLQGSYDNSWKFRPTLQNEFYNECTQGKNFDDTDKQVIDTGDVFEVKKTYKMKRDKDEQLYSITIKDKRRDFVVADVVGPNIKRNNMELHILDDKKGLAGNTETGNFYPSSESNNDDSENSEQEDIIVN